MDPVAHPGCKRFYWNQVAGLFTCFLAFIVLLGWCFDIHYVKSFGSGLATMKFNTALCFFLTGFTLWHLSRFQPSNRAGIAAVVSASLVLVISLLTLLEYILGVDCGIDQLIVADPATLPENYPGRMSGATTVNFFILGVSQFMLLKGGRRVIALSQGLALLVIVGGFIGVVGYLRGTDALYSLLGFSSMALHTSVLFLILGLGTLLLRPREGLLATVTSKNIGGIQARRLIPVAIVLPIILGWLLLSGEEKQYYGEEMKTVIFVAITILIFVSLLWLSARHLNRVHDDLLQRNQALLVAERKNAHFAAIVAFSEDAIISKDLNGIVTSWNKGASEIFGYEATEMIGQPITMLIPPEYHADEADILRRIRQGEQIEHFETVRQRKNGVKFDVSVTISPILDSSGKVIGASKITRDITEEMRVRACLQASLREVQEFKTALDEHAIVAITDPQGSITYANDKFCAISKYSRDELIGENHRILNSGHHPKEFFVDLWKTICSGKVWHGEICNHAKDGAEYWVDTTIVPFLGENGKPRQYIAIRADITSRVHAAQVLSKQTEELLRSNADLAQFAYVASHDLQEPLRGVSGCIELLQKRYTDRLDERGLEYMRHAVVGITRMQKLIRDLLEYSRLGTRTKEFTKFELKEALLEATSNLSVAIGESSTVLKIGQLPVIEGDKAQMTQLFQNLLGNAIKFRGDEPPQIEISARAVEDHWEISVADSGIGIDPKFQEKIFIIFQRLHSRERYSGTGIGLALCKRIVLRHGGEIWVKPNPGGGSVFRFTVKNKLG